MRTHSFSSLFACWVVSAGCSAAAHAALGESMVRVSAADGVNTPTLKASKNAALRSTQGSGWVSQQTVLETGTLVQEFASASDGVVFAVSWQGPVLPDLNGLLGKYFPHFARAAESRREARRFGGSMQVNAAGLVMNSGGRMRNFSGFAYVPALVPASVTINELLF